MKQFPRFGFTVLLYCLFTATAARGVILFDTGDPEANTSAPTGPLAGSGWQFEGQWGSFLGTPIAAHFFLSAAHIGNAGAGTFVYQGVYYHAIASFSLGGSDLLLWKVAETFPTFAPLCTAADEIGRHLVVIGRGTQRGDEIYLNDTLRGWSWGPTDSRARWGENDVTSLVPYQGHLLLYATFDQHVQPNDHSNEAALSVGDSGGAVFLQGAESGSWTLAGINFAVDDLYTAPDPATDFTAAIFDARGYYSSDGADPPTFTLIEGDTPVPTGFYASDISSEIAWIGSVLAEPSFATDGRLMSLTYNRLIAPAGDVSYEVQQSNDLVSWSAATTVDEVVASNGDIETVKATVDPGDSPQLFLRVSVSRPSP